MRVNKYFLPLFGVVPMVAMVLIAQFTGNFSTSGRVAVDMGNMKPEDIKGWMTWQEVSDGFGIPLNQLYALAGVPGDIPPTTAMKDMEGLLEGFETTIVREVIAAYLAGTPPPSAESGLVPVSTVTPATPTLEAAPAAAPAATEAPSAGGVATPVQPAMPQEHVPAGDGAGVGMGEGAGPTPLPPGQVLPAGEIKGRHTLADVAQQAAVPLDKLIAALNLPADVDPNTPIKDLVNTGAIAEVQTVRDAVVQIQTESP